MEEIICEHLFNWKRCNLTIKHKIPFIFENDKLIYSDNFIDMYKIIINGNKEGVSFYKSINRYNFSFYINNIIENKVVELRQFDTFKIKCLYKINYVNGKKNGKERRWYSNGNKIEIDFIDDMIHGKHIFYFADGIVNETNYSHGKINGKSILKFANGKIWVESDYINGFRTNKIIYTN